MRCHREALINRVQPHPSSRGDEVQLSAGGVLRELLPMTLDVSFASRAEKRATRLLRRAYLTLANGLLASGDALLVGVLSSES